MLEPMYSQSRVAKLHTLVYSPADVHATNTKELVANKATNEAV